MTIDVGDRPMLRIAARNAAVPIDRKPSWIRTRPSMTDRFLEVEGLVQSQGLHTVCREAACPNIYECWDSNEATFLIAGNRCTRRCDFCQIDTGTPEEVDLNEPRRVAESVRTMGLHHATITGVARDDRQDGAAWLYAETVRQVHALNPGTNVELLVPDFQGRAERLATVFESRPEVFAHNIETVARIFRTVRPGFRYTRSLDVISAARTFGLVTKSNLILGLGETAEEIDQTLSELRDAGCDLLTVTQYLRPSLQHRPVHRWVKPEEFVDIRERALSMGFAGVLAGPLVRSSYRAGHLYKQAMASRP